MSVPDFGMEDVLLTITELRTRLLRNGTEPKAPLGQVLRLHDYIVSLTHTNRYIGCIIWHNRNEICRDNFQCMVVNHETEVLICCSVD